MDKHSLASIVVDKCLNRQFSKTNKSLSQQGRAQRSRKETRLEQVNQNNRMIKITQFSSELLLNSDQLVYKTHSTSYSSSPTKNFNIKRINDFKNNVLYNTQKIIDIELKRKGKFSKKQLEQPPKIVVNHRGMDDDLYEMDLLNLGSCSPQAVMVFKPQKSSCPMQLSDGLAVAQPTSLILKQSPTKKSYKSIRKKQILEQVKVDDRKWSASPRRSYNRHIIEQKKYQQNLQRQKRQILEMKKQLNKNYAKPFNPPENISASAYIIYETDFKPNKRVRKFSALRRDPEEGTDHKKIFMHSHQVIVSLNSRTPVQIASLTKIMTCLVTLNIACRYNINPAEEMVTIGQFQQNISGTSANIQKGEIYSIQQLLHGLMLPSGNDASLALAVWGGRILLSHEKINKQQNQSVSTSEEEKTQIKFKKRQSYERFLQEMNKQASDLHLQKTKYCNSHGLSHPQNRSCPYDLAVLCEYAMNNEHFRKIVGCPSYECQINKKDENKLMLKRKVSEQVTEDKLMQLEMGDLTGQMQYELLEEDDIPGVQSGDNIGKQVRWQNTHPLLQSKPDLYVGIKTGITTTAGPCLASCIECNERRFIIIVLNCKSMKQRNRDTQILRKWLFNKEGIKPEQIVCDD